MQSVRTEGARRRRTVSVFTAPIVPGFVTWILSRAPSGSRLRSKPRSRSSRAAVAVDRATSRVRRHLRPRRVRQRALTLAPFSTSSVKFRSVVERRPAVNV
jgi:hypothetical protein